MAGSVCVWRRRGGGVNENSSVGVIHVDPR